MEHVSLAYESRLEEISVETLKREYTALLRFVHDKHCLEFSKEAKEKLILVEKKLQEMNVSGEELESIRLQFSQESFEAQTIGKHGVTIRDAMNRAKELVSRTLVASNQME